MRQKLVDLVMVLCALAMVGLAVRSQFARGAQAAPTAPIDEVTDWEQYQDSSRIVGQGGASASIVVFSDYQCPYCKALWHVVDSVAREMPAKVSVTMRHFPIDRIHAQARKAGVLAECARRDGRFRVVDSLLFAWPDSVRLERWDAIGRAAGMTDASTISACMEDPSVTAIVAGDEAAARALGATGTPMMLVNQQRVRGYVDVSTLRRLVGSAK